MKCPNCGAEIAENSTFCGYCGQSVQQQPVEQPVYQQPVYQQPVQQPAPVEKPENVISGTVGALGGAVIGGLLIVLLSQINFVASISGLVLAFCTLWGYEKLGGKLSTKGIVICVILMLITPYIANRIDWAIFISDELGISFGDAFEVVPDYAEWGILENYTSNLVMLYLFTILGGAATVWDKIKNRKK